MATGAKLPHHQSPASALAACAPVSHWNLAQYVATLGFTPSIGLRDPPLAAAVRPAGPRSGTGLEVLRLNMPTKGAERGKCNLYLKSPGIGAGLRR
jgi:hypothetical protein